MGISGSLEEEVSSLLVKDLEVLVLGGIRVEGWAPPKQRKESCSLVHRRWERQNTFKAC